MSGRLLAIETEPDDFAGWHSLVVELGMDAVLHVTDSFGTEEDAEDAARQWVAKCA